MTELLQCTFLTQNPVKACMDIGRGCKFEFNEDMLDSAMALFNSLKVSSLYIYVSSTVKCRRRPETHVGCQFVKKFLVAIAKCLNGKLLQKIYLRGFEIFNTKCCENILEGLPRISGFSDTLVVANTALYPNELERILHKGNGLDGFLPIFLKNVQDGSLKDVTIDINIALNESTLNSLKNALTDKRCRLQTLYVKFQGRNTARSTLEFYNDLFRSISKLPSTLTKLCIDGFFETDSLGSLVKGMKKIKLAHLELSGIAVDKPSAMDLANFIASDACTLLDLKLSFVEFGSAEIAIARAIRMNKSVSKLALHQVFQNQQATAEWNACLQQNCAITNLKLEYFVPKPELFFNGSLSADENASNETFYADIVASNNTLKVFGIQENRLTLAQEKNLEEAIANNYNIVSLCYRSDYLYKYYHVDHLPEGNAIINCLKRNAAIAWRESIHNDILGYCLAMSFLGLPQYILLWIYDWLPPFMHLVSHRRKIHLITNVLHSISQVKENRIKSNKLRKRKV